MKNSVLPIHIEWDVFPSELRLITANNRWYTKKLGFENAPKKSHIDIAVTAMYELYEKIIKDIENEA